MPPRVLIPRGLTRSTSQGLRHCGGELQAQGGRANVKAFTDDEPGYGTSEEKNLLVVTMYQMLKSAGRNDHDKDAGVAVTGDYSHFGERQ